MRLEKCGEDHDFSATHPFAQAGPEQTGKCTGERGIMDAMNKIVIASNNPGKLAEFGALLAPLDFEAVPQSTLNVSEAEEPHVTFIENALAKARHASAATGLPALADDSGICAIALNGAPGVYSARYAGEPKSDQRNNEN